jgi:hypothetical protein
MSKIRGAILRIAPSFKRAEIRLGCPRSEGAKGSLEYVKDNFFPLAMPVFPQNLPLFSTKCPLLGDYFLLNTAPFSRHPNTMCLYLSNFI